MTSPGLFSMCEETNTGRGQISSPRETDQAARILQTLHEEMSIQVLSLRLQMEGPSRRCDQQVRMPRVFEKESGALVPFGP